MHSPIHPSFGFSRWLIPAITIFLLTVGCAPPVQRPTGPARDYEDAKDFFKRGRLEKATDITNALAESSPPTAFTDRARVLQAVIYAGQVEAYKELADAYGKGADQTRNSRFKAEYDRLRHDNLQFASRAALGLAETAHQMTLDGTLPKEVTLEAPFPSAEGPGEVKELERVRQGGWIEPDQQESASIDAVRKGVDDVLAGIVSGDRAKARTALSQGSTKIDGVDFAIFLGNGLVDGATIFDRKHGRDSTRLKTVCNEADTVAKAALALLKDNPNAEKEKQVKKLQDRIKTTLKSA